MSNTFGHVDKSQARAIWAGVTPSRVGCRRSYGIAKNVKCVLTAAGRPKCAVPRQLHGTEVQSVNSMAGQ
jgi:hypothetical protein